MVLLHCALMTSAIWSPIIGELSASYRTYAVDVMGDVGRTVPTAPPATEADAFGGGMATNFAMHHPDRVERLALLAPFKPFVQQGPGFLYGFLPFLSSSRRMAQRFEKKMCFKDDFGYPEHSELLYQRYRSAYSAISNSAS